jgi:ABC-2 type transport system permease protein
MMSGTRRTRRRRAPHRVRDRTLLLMTYLFPLGFYGFLGVFMTEMNPSSSTVMIPGMAVFAMLAAAMFGCPAR